MNSKISIQIATWKRKEMLKKLILSLEFQSLEREEYEICICDSDSNDGTKNMIDDLNEVFKNIKYYNIKENILSVKRNYLFKNTDAELIITMDDDLIADSNFIKNHLIAHRNSKNIVFCGQVRFPNEWVSSSNYYKYRDSKHLKDGNIIIDNLPSQNIVVMNMSLKKYEIDKIGFMDENFVKYGGEDTEFGIRLKQNNIQIKYLNDAIVYHFENSSFDKYLYKLYITARFGFKQLLEKFPNYKFNSQLNFLFPIKDTDNLLIKSNKLIYRILINSLFSNAIKYFLLITDRISIFYSYRLYNFVCANALKKGIKDQKLESNDSNYL